jgi:hypothetical protein
MRYRDITADVSNRFQLPSSHPYLAKIVIDPVNWHDLQRLDADDLTIRILSHDTPCDGQMTVYVACASFAVRDRLEDGWG